MQRQPASTRREDTGNWKDLENSQSYRPLLFSIAYRMLGSVMDAEDCVQEVFLQWHNAIAEGTAQTIENPKAYLCTMITRRCIDHLRSARVQRESYMGLWLPEPLLTAGDPSELSEMSESLSAAFLLLLERLTPTERAVYLLRQVFDYDYAEIATFVGKSAESCRQIMHRARQHLPLRRSHAHVSHEEQQHIFAQFMQACMNGDMDGLLRVLSEEVVAHSDGGDKVSAARKPIYGAQRVARYLLGAYQKFYALAGVVLRPALLNAQPGIIGYQREDSLFSALLAPSADRQSGAKGMAGMSETTKKMLEQYRRSFKKGAPVFTLTLTIADGYIQEVDIVINPDKLCHIPPLSPAELAENGLTTDLHF